MTDIIALVVLVVILGAAALYVYKEKKRGVKCIGCPAGRSCSGAKNGEGCGGGCSGCHIETTK